MKLDAHAKINWSLDVLRSQENGYHQLDMLMQPVTLADQITLLPADDLILRMSGTPLLPATTDNLAYRAASLLQNAAHCRKGAVIHVEKRIPAGAGMGGGSADAAGVLFGLNQLWQTGLSRQELEKLGLQLGADVPFCLRGGLCRVRGIGEQITSLPASPRFPLCVIQPCEGLSTRDVFTAWDSEAEPLHPAMDAVQQALFGRDPAAISAALGNSLQRVSSRIRPQIGSALSDLLAYGAFASLMTGSGSAVFGVFHTPAEAAAAEAKLRSRYPFCAVCETCGDSISIHQEN